jgi:transcriptional regulator with XRE-family HTH domain
MFGLRIKELRDDRGLTQEDLADLVGLFRTYMSRIETGAANPTFDVILALATALKVHVCALFEPPSITSARRTRAAVPTSRGRVRR